jgi:hypothetical protein
MVLRMPGYLVIYAAILELGRAGKAKRTCIAQCRVVIYCSVQCGDGNVPRDISLADGWLCTGW